MLFYLLLVSLIPLKAKLVEVVFMVDGASFVLLSLLINLVELIEPEATLLLNKLLVPLRVGLVSALFQN